MRKIKIIRKANLQSEIDDWVKKENPIIHSTSLSTSVLQNGNVQNVIAIVYDEKIIIDKSKVIKEPFSVTRGDDKTAEYLRQTSQ